MVGDNMMQNEDNNLALPLVELAPLLDRFVDDEVSEEERTWVEQLLEERSDVCEYIASLEWTAQQIHLVVSNDVDVDLSQFWTQVEARIDRSSEEHPPQEREEDASQLLEQVILYHDGELKGEKCEEIEELLEPSKKTPLSLEAQRLHRSLKITGEFVRGACDQALENVAFEHISEKVTKSVNISSSGTSTSLESLSTTPANDNFFKRYKQAIAGALAATMILGMAALVYFAVGGGKRTIINKTVVLVEDVKYGPGFSGEVVNPVQQVSAQVKNSSDSNEDLEDPTVIWIHDDEKNQPKATEGESTEKLKKNEKTSKKSKRRGLSI